MSANTDNLIQDLDRNLIEAFQFLAKLINGVKSQVAELQAAVKSGQPQGESSGLSRDLVASLADRETAEAHFSHLQDTLVRIQTEVRELRAGQDQAPDPEMTLALQRLSGLPATMRDLLDGALRPLLEEWTQARTQQQAARTLYAAQVGEQAELLHRLEEQLPALGAEFRTSLEALKARLEQLPQHLPEQPPVDLGPVLSELTSLREQLTAEPRPEPTAPIDLEPLRGELTRIRTLLEDRDAATPDLDAALVPLRERLDQLVQSTPVPAPSLQEIGEKLETAIAAIQLPVRDAAHAAPDIAAIVGPLAAKLDEITTALGAIRTLPAAPAGEATSAPTPSRNEPELAPLVTGLRETLAQILAAVTNAAPPSAATPSPVLDLSPLLAAVQSQEQQIQAIATTIRQVDQQHQELLRRAEAAPALPDLLAPLMARIGALEEQNRSLLESTAALQVSTESASEFPPTEQMRLLEQKLGRLEAMLPAPAAAAPADGDAIERLERRIDQLAGALAAVKPMDDRLRQVSERLAALDDRLDSGSEASAIRSSSAVLESQLNRLDLLLRSSTPAAPQRSTEPRTPSRTHPGAPSARDPAEPAALDINFLVRSQLGHDGAG
ncbi:MAG: hypothetical protein K0Q72_2199 [Armatimonadetes bacterium]|jgi:DNA repair exonuclease SbcCD ATPase subunit|nr:hypothetical protein [Armatimonadota bacterium]